MRLSFLPAKQLHEAHTRGLFVHLHKKWQLEAEEKPSISLSPIFVGFGLIPRCLDSSTGSVHAHEGGMTCPGCTPLSWCRGRLTTPIRNEQRWTENGAITTWLFDNFVNFSPPFNILSGRLKAARSLCHYLQQPVAYCNSSLQSWQDVFEFIIATKSAPNLPLERRSVRAGSVCAHPQ